MDQIRIGIVGYGNLGRGVEYALRQNPDVSRLLANGDPTVTGPLASPFTGGFQHIYSLTMFTVAVVGILWYYRPRIFETVGWGIAVLLGLLCGGVKERTGRWLLVVCTALLSLWMGSQIVYFHLFKTFLTIFSITKMAMVAGAFGDMAVGQILMNWFPILMMVLPVVLVWYILPSSVPLPRTPPPWVHPCPGGW